MTTINKSRISVIAIWLFCCICDYYIGSENHLSAQQCFLPLIVAGIAAAASIAGSVASTSAANKRLRKADRMTSDKEKRLSDWYQAEMGANTLDRPDAQAALRQVRENNREAMKVAETDAIKRGMTDEAKVAQAAKLNRGYADAVAQIVASGQRHKDQVQQQYMAELGNIENMKIGRMMDTSGAQALGNTISSAGNALGSVVGGMGGTSVKTPSMAVKGAQALAATGEKAAAGYGIPKNYKITL